MHPDVNILNEKNQIMKDIDVTNPAWWFGIALMVISYLLIDAHKSIKVSIKEKADLTAMDTAFAMHAREMEAMEARHADEVQRIERQYAEWRASVVQQFSDRMNAMESNLTGRMDLILKLIERRHLP